LKSIRIALITLAAVMATMVAARMLFGPFGAGLISVTTRSIRRDFSE
jgi:hypothetical protein